MPSVGSTLDLLKVLGIGYPDLLQILGMGPRDLFHKFSR